MFQFKTKYIPLNYNYNLSKKATTFKVKIVFFNTVGVIVKEIDLPLGQGEHQVDLQNLPASIYHYKIYVNGEASKFGKVILIN